MINTLISNIPENDKLIVTHDSGFFSCCTIRLRKIIDFYNEYKRFPIVDSSRQWGKYKDSEGDVTDSFFKTLDISKTLDNVEFIYCDTEEQYSDYSLINYPDVSFFVEKYFSISDAVLKTKNELIAKYNIDVNKTIAVCYRGNDKCKETNVPTHKDMLKKVQEVKKEFPEYKLLIQSDEVDFYEKIKKAFPDIIVFEEIKKIKHSSKKTVSDTIFTGEKVMQAQLFLSILSILSDCSKVIINSGNVGMWICLYRGNPVGVTQYLDPKKYIYGVKTPNYKKVKNKWLDHEAYSHPSL